MRRIYFSAYFSKTTELASSERKALTLSPLFMLLSSIFRERGFSIKRRAYLFIGRAFMSFLQLLIIFSASEGEHERVIPILLARSSISLMAFLAISRRSLSESLLKTIMSSILPRSSGRSIFERFFSLSAVSEALFTANPRVPDDSLSYPIFEVRMITEFEKSHTLPSEEVRVPSSSI